MLDKLSQRNNPRVNLTSEVQLLLRQGARYTQDDALATLAYVFSDLLPELAGLPWKSASDVLRQQSQRYPVLRDLADAVSRGNSDDRWQPGNV